MYATILNRKIKRVYDLKGNIEDRTISLANYILEENATVRSAAKKFGVSKSTVHKDVTERLMKIDPALARDTHKILDENKAERHIRGGMATKQKYMREKNKTI